MRLKVCLEPLAEAGNSWDEFNVRRHVAQRWKRLLVTWVRETTKLARTLDRSRVSSQRRTSSDKYCGAVPVSNCLRSICSLTCCRCRQLSWRCLGRCTASDEHAPSYWSTTRRRRTSSRSTSQRPETQKEPAAGTRRRLFARTCCWSCCLCMSWTSRNWRCCSTTLPLYPAIYIHLHCKSKRLDWRSKDGAPKKHKTTDYGYG